jgi:hypothetical protein
VVAGTVDLDLLGHRKSDAVRDRPQPLDLVGAARLLAAEPVAREADHREGAAGELLRRLRDLWSPAKAGGEPTELASGLYHLSDVALDGGEAIYFTDTAGAELGPWRLRRVGRAAPVAEMPTSWFGPPIVAQDDRYLYLLADFRIVRVPKQGGEAEPASLPRENGIAAATIFDGVLYGADAGLWWSEGDDGPSHYECGAVVAVTAAGGAYQELAAETEEANAIWVDDAYVYWTSYRGAIFRTAR